MFCELQSPEIHVDFLKKRDDEIYSDFCIGNINVELGLLTKNNFGTFSMLRYHPRYFSIKNVRVVTSFKNVNRPFSWS